jgi:hypothetical protein
MPSYNVQGELIEPTITIQEHNVNICLECCIKFVCVLILCLVIALIAVNAS